MLHFFCGQHTFMDPQVTFPGPIGAMRSLVLQLLFAIHWKNEFSLRWSPAEIEPELVEGNPISILAVFSAILPSLALEQRTECYVVIDNPHNAPGMDEEVARLHGLVEELGQMGGQSEVVLKILVTNPPAWQLAYAHSVALE